MTQIAFVIYPGFTVLDVIGPYQALAGLPGLVPLFVAAEVGPVSDQSGQAQLMAVKRLEEVSEPDVIVVSGGDTNVLDRRIIDWLQGVHPTATWTTSVCTGSIYLAAAGLLEGVAATTHWAWAERLEQLGAVYTHTRVVEQGKIITAAGVSSGIDMGLTLLDRMYGTFAAQAVQLGMEYDPEPPYDAGSPLKAPAAVVELIRSTSGPRGGRTDGRSW